MKKNGQGKKLNPKQKKAIEALLSGLSQGDAAAAAGVGTSTFQRWLKEDLFQAELDRRTNAAIVGATRRLAGTLDLAVDTFRVVMLDDKASQAIRLRAANYAAQHAVKLLETAEILRRLETIEDLLAGQLAGQIL